jgi:hypothetical protein
LTEVEARQDDVKSRLLTEGWTMAENDVRAGVWPRQPRLDLWYLPSRNAATEPFTELDVLYGNAVVREGWELVGVVTNSSDKTAVSLVGRRKPNRALASRPEWTGSRLARSPAIQTGFALLTEWPLPDSPARRLPLLH